MININDSEVDSNIALDQAIRYIGDQKNGFLSSFGRIFQYSDEPKFFQYYAQVRDILEKSTGSHGTASGFSFFSQKAAALKCLLEALERYANKNYAKSALTFSTAQGLHKPSLDVSEVASFSNKQRKLKNFQVNPNGRYNWVLGKRLPKLEDIYIPAQLVYLSYRRNEDEGLIRLPISTGAACGSAYSAAIYRGLCEIIERDAYMIMYLNKLQCPRVPLEESINEDIQKILTIAKNYNLQVYCYDISTDLDIYTFFTVIYDPTGVAATISTGLKSSLNPIEAVLGSLQEAFHPRTWLRREKDKFTGVRSELMMPVELSQRGVLWSSLDVVEEFDFLFNSAKVTRSIDSYKDKSQKTSALNLRHTTRLLKNKDCDAYFVDITPDLPSIKKTKFKVVMTIVPKLHPLYLDERYPYFGGERLYSVPLKLGYLKRANSENTLNKFPHPFL